MTAWTDHVRKMAGELGLTYACALSDARVKGSFTKATRAPRKSRAKGTPYIVPLDLTEEETTANRARAMERVKAMKAKRLANPPAPKKRKPMSEETKAKLKERRAMKKADRVYNVSEKFDAFWNRHEGIPAGGAVALSGVRSATLAQIAKDAAQSAIDRVAVSEKRAVASAITESIADMIGGAVSTMPVKKKRKKRESADQKEMREIREKRLLDPMLIKPPNVASKMHKPRKPTTRKSKLTPLSADDMSLAFSLLN